MDVNKTEVKTEDSLEETQVGQEVEKEQEKKSKDMIEELNIDMADLPKPKDVEPLVILASEINETMNKRQKCVSQFELVLHGRGILLCETYYNQKCVWQEDKGCFRLYIPMYQKHDRRDEWYVYPAARFFAGEQPFYMNLSLNPRLRPVFSPKDIKLENNYFCVRYKKQRQRGVVLPAGMLLGSLYLNEPWQVKPTNYEIPKNM